MMTTICLVQTLWLSGGKETGGAPRPGEKVAGVGKTRASSDPVSKRGALGAPGKEGIHFRPLDTDAHREQAQGVVSHRGFGDQPLRAGTHSADRPGIGSTQHIEEYGGTHHREDDASADHAIPAHSGGGVIGDAPRHTGEAQSVHRHKHGGGEHGQKEGVDEMAIQHSPSRQGGLGPQRVRASSSPRRRSW